MTKEALTLALEALRMPSNYWNKTQFIKVKEAIAAAEEALAQPEQEPVAAAWDEGYRQGVQDERTSEANIGIAGFGAKVQPARQNPYGTTPPQRKPLTDGSPINEGTKEQEPVAVVTGVYGGRFTYAPFKSTAVLPVGMALYLQPPQRTAAVGEDTRRAWVGLDDTDLAMCAGEDEVRDARYWERVCKEKNI